MVLVKIEQANRQRLRLSDQTARLESVAALLVDKYARSIYNSIFFETLFLKLGVIRTSDQIERVVGVEVGPPHRVGQGVDSGQLALLEMRIAQITPIRHASAARAGAMGEHDIKQAIAINIHSIYSPGIDIRQRLALKVELAAIPQNRALTIGAGKDQVEQPIAI